MNGNAGEDVPSGPIVGIVRRFLTGRLSIILILLAAALGVWAVRATPREEEPQIVVPLADVIVQYPGHDSEEVEKLVATPLERLLWQIVVALVSRNSIEIDGAMGSRDDGCHGRSETRLCRSMP